MPEKLAQTFPNMALSRFTKQRRQAANKSVIVGVLLLAMLSACSASSPEDDYPAGPVKLVHAPGKPFSVTLRFDSKHDCAMHYHWQDFRGETLSPSKPLPLNREVELSSVSGASGYLGLVLRTDCPDLDDEEGFAGGRREMGFAILPTPKRSLRSQGAASPFGMVQGRLDDPWIGPWVKTLTWHTTSAKWWHYEMERRAAVGTYELPMINGESWDSDDDKPLSPAALESLAKRAAAYFEAWPDRPYWELGLEENLEAHFHKPYYWQNLAAKVKTLRKVADRHAPGARFLYQIANLDLDDVRAFAASEAAKHFDILSLHPYAWPDFPSPDRWLDDYLRQVRDILKRRGLDLPIWFTEVGAPHHGNGPGLFFGYPATGAAVTGLTRYQAVNYLLKLHAIALHAKVEKIFWYNYRDRDFGNDYAENFFGMIDYWGYPKPVRVAYGRMVSCLDGQRPKRVFHPGGDIVAYEFGAGAGRVTLAWKRSSGHRSVPLSRLGIEAGQTYWLGDPMGATLTPENGRISIGEEPVWIATGNAVPNCKLAD